MKSLKQTILKLIPEHIGHQIGFVFAILLIISLGFLGFSLITASQQAVKNSVLRDYQDIARRASHELEKAVTHPRDLLTNTAVLMGNIPQTDRETRKTILYQFFTDHSTKFQQISFLDLTGREIISSDWARPLKNYSAEPIFQEVKQTRQPTSSEVFFSPENIPYLQIAVPVQRLNTLTGFLLAEMKLASLWGIVASIKLTDGEAFLVDEQGYMLVHNEERRVYRGENLSHLATVQSVLSGTEGSREEITGSENTAKKWLSAYAPIKPFGWGLIIRQPTRTAYAFSTRMRRTAIGTIVLAMALAILLSILLGRWIIKPVKKLVHSTKLVAAGDLDHEIKTGRNDELGRLLRSFNEMIQKLKKARQMEKLSNIGLATSKIGHELRNPLVSIKTFIQLLGRRKEDAEFIDKFNELVPGEMARLEKMVHNLTEFSTAPRLQLTECKLDKLIAGSLSLLRERLDQHKINVTTQIETNRTPLVADEDRLKQVFINLILNAIGSMEQGGRLQIKAHLTNGVASTNNSNHKSLSIEIKDTGCGIPPEELSELFEPFKTFKKGGLGLGLTICKEIIEQHRGKIKVISTIDQGTT
ncbi:MAG: sensor histidine kinase, partial [Planctomycetes bacterium]|nr:sensor histidine kinase [Planctomycetota bacterium]